MKECDSGSFALLHEYILLRNVHQYTNVGHYVLLHPMYQRIASPVETADFTAKSTTLIAIQ